MLFKEDNYLSLLPQQETYFTEDDTCQGLYCQVAPTGRRTWVLRYTPPGSKQTEVRLGPCGTASKGGRSITEARKQAGDLKAGKLTPADFRIRAPKGGAKPLPLGVTTKKGLSRTVLQIVAAYLESEHSAEWQPKTRKQYTQVLQQYLVEKIGTRIAKDIHGGDAALILGAIESARTKAIFSGKAEAVWDYLGVLENLVTRNPWVGHGVPQGTKNRTRVIEDKELPLFKARLVAWDGEEKYKIAWQLFLETALRHENICHTRWEWVNLQNCWIKFPPTAYKRGERKNEYLYIALTDHAVALLKQLQKITGDTPFLYPGKGAGKHAGKVGMPQSDFQNQWDDFLEGTGFEDLWIHDLRRTLASRVSSLGYKPYAAQLLGHVGIQSATDLYALTALTKLREILEEAAPHFR
jgi:integrase